MKVFTTKEDILLWINALNEKEHFKVEQERLDSLQGWHFDGTTGNIIHESGKFYSVEGLEVYQNGLCWTQPIINQPEIGILGFIAKEVNGTLCFLLQAKIEAGNVNGFQISPTVQATRSNFMRVHGGKSVRFLEYFVGGGKGKVLVDQLQSERNGRFYHKRNRNIVVQIPENEEIELTPNFRWATLKQIKQLCRIDNIINMDTRSVVSCISSETAYCNGLFLGEEDSSSLCSDEFVLQNMSFARFKNDEESKLVPLYDLSSAGSDWKYDGAEIKRKDEQYFKIIGVKVRAGNREVKEWSQPLSQQTSIGLCGFIAKEINGIIHFLAKMRVEAGARDILELGPTVQGSAFDVKKQRYQAWFFEEDINPNKVLFKTLQSEEGGRFYHDQNIYTVRLVDKSFSVNPSSPNYIWLTLPQMKRLLNYSNMINVEARSLIAII